MSGLTFEERDGKYFIVGGTDGDVEIPKEVYDTHQQMEAEDEDED